MITDAAAGVGALGRVLLVRTVGFESPDHFELLEELESGLCEQMDWLLCGGGDGDGDGSVLIDEPVLICFQTNDELTANLARLQLELDPSDDSADGGCARYLTQLLTQHVQEYELASPILSREWNAHEPALPATLKRTQVVELPETSFVPSLHVEMDGGYVSNRNLLRNDDMDTTVNKYWDTSTLLVFDTLVSPDLRKRLLDVMIGSDSHSKHYDARNGPDPTRWVSQFQSHTFLPLDGRVRTLSQPRTRQTTLHELPHLSQRGMDS